MTKSRACVLGLCLALAAGGAAADEVERDFHQTFDVKRGDRLRLDHGDGDVVVESWERDQLDVVVRYHQIYRRVGVGSKIGFDVDFSQSGSTVRVIGRESGHWSFGFFSSRELEYLYTIRAPSYLNLDFEGDDGDVEISGWDGEIRLRNEDGDVDLAEIRSPRTEVMMDDGDITIKGLQGGLIAEAEDGDLWVSDCAISEGRIRLDDGNATFVRCSGSLRVELEDGDLELQEFRPGGIDVRTDDGDVEMELLPAEAMDVEVRTGDGNVTVKLAAGSSAEFSIDTDDGGIRLDAPGAVNVSQRESSVSGTLGNGAGRLRIIGGDGRVVLRGAS